MRKLILLNAALLFINIGLYIADVCIDLNDALGTRCKPDIFKGMDLRQFLEMQEVLPNEIIIIPSAKSSLLKYDGYVSWWHQYPKIEVLVNRDRVEGIGAIYQ